MLLVEDYPAMCDLLAAQLRRRGYQALLRPSATEALSLLSAEDVDVVVADHNMPGTTGISLCEELTANRPERRWW